MTTKINLEDKIKDAGYHKFSGIAPDGFVLIPEEVIEDLKDFDNWKEFKIQEDWIERQSKKVLTNP